MLVAIQIFFEHLGKKSSIYEVVAPHIPVCQIMLLKHLSQVLQTGNTKVFLYFFDPSLQLIKSNIHAVIQRVHTGVYAPRTPY
jgi:hypothetical protein